MDLDEWRSRINNLDNQILNLLNQRADAALKIGDFKRHSGAPVYAPDREAEWDRPLAELKKGAWVEINIPVAQVPRSHDVPGGAKNTPWAKWIAMSSCRAISEP